MTTLTRNETAEFLLSHDRYCILTHRRPDGDTIGSAAALCLCLRKLGKTAHILQNPEVTDRFSWLHQGLTKEKAEENDTVVTVDVASPSMLPKAFEHLLGRIPLRIDHHGSAVSFTDYELVDPAAGACAEIIYDLITAMGCEMDSRMADAVYVGTSTDTGCFRFANTTAHTFQTAAACAAAGARVYGLNQVLFETNTLGRLRMQGWIVDHLRVFDSGRLAIVAIPRAVEEQIGVTSDDMDNISSFPRTVAGVCMAATLRETKEGDVKLSVRAIPGYDATAITAQFGGGGHKGAAGATIHLPLEEAAKAVETAMLALN
ncbi:MAG: DHH family phosphoesterase [Oscillospiraceae bacterium]|nr:DHH family phosphoesterase [Oscillospiraceae bacterium]